MYNILKSTKQWFQGKPLLALGILAVSLLLVACDANAKQSTFGTAGPVAEGQLLIFNVLLWVMVVVFILVEGALLYAAIRFRRRPGQPLPKQTHGNTARSGGKRNIWRFSKIDQLSLCEISLMKDDSTGPLKMSMQLNS